MKKTYKFTLKDGKEYTYEMTQEQRNCFYTGAYIGRRCRNCEQCLFNVDNCLDYRGFLTNDIKSITEVKEDKPMKTKKYKFLSKNGAERFFNMTLVERNVFSFNEKGMASCGECSRCFFKSTCTSKGFSVHEFKTITEIKPDLSRETIKKAVMKVFKEKESTEFNSIYELKDWIAIGNKIKALENIKIDTGNILCWNFRQWKKVIKKKTKKVKLLAYLDEYRGDYTLMWRSGDKRDGYTRVPSEDKEVEVEI